jgi:hypothetical protein
MYEKEKRTEDEGDNNGLHVLSAGLVGVSRKIGDVKTEGRVVTQDSIEI